MHYWVQAAREPARTTDLQPAAPAATVPTARTTPSGPGGPGGTDGRRALVESDLRLAACGFLLIDPADVDLSADLMELGFDSVSLVQLTGRIGDTYGVEVEPVVVFDHPTLADLGRLLLTGFADAVDARHRKLTDGTADAAPADGDEQP
ncbi:acyl carrier protein [Kitasatospora purpeofusca]|uniref:Acyl carrier protein n=1 Tax=Kitasatospora purpeofusca TaxID=67352 RepID=A0ABZ1UBI3_9ACTN|nr:acyl carrier protein [Kitasatospora purpeofusca]